MPKVALQPPKRFKAYEPGFVHIDVKYLPKMQDEASRKYLFVAIDRATRWVYLEIRKDKSAKSAQAFLKTLLKKAPFKIRKILTDNGKEFTDRFSAAGERQDTRRPTAWWSASMAESPRFRQPVHQKSA